MQPLQIAEPCHVLREAGDAMLTPLAEIERDRLGAVHIFDVESDRLTEASTFPADAAPRAGDVVQSFTVHHELRRSTVERFEELKNKVGVAPDSDRSLAKIAAAAADVFRDTLEFEEE